MLSSSKIITKLPSKTLQIRKTVKNTIEQEKALRDQLHAEIENKTKACSNPTYNCSIPRLDGYEYCIRHILQDPRAPYKQCAYVYAANGKKCTQAAPKHDVIKKETATSAALTNYCFEHSRQVQLNKTHEIVGQYKQVETNESYLNDLTHHIRIDKQDSPVHLADTDEEIDVVSSNVEPFVNYVHVAKFDSKNDIQQKRRILDYASDSSANDDTPTINNTWKNHEWDNSDNESVDSQNEDFLKHAGIYTTEEATMITKQKMLRLQSLYTEQVLRMQHLLKEKRRKYLQAIRKERETLCSIHDQSKDSVEERKLYEKLKALNHYHKKHGVESVLRKKFHERRLKAVEGLAVHHHHKGPLYTKCVFTEGGVKCGERALPCCKYCRKHILEDKKQILFRACGVEKSGIVCQESVPNIFEDATCVLHINFPTHKAYTQKKFESETEEDDEDNLKKIIIKTEARDIEDEIKQFAIKQEITFAKNEKDINQHQQQPRKSQRGRQKQQQQNEDVEMMIMKPKDDDDDVENNVTIAHHDNDIKKETTAIMNSSTVALKESLVKQRKSGIDHDINEEENSTEEGEILFEITAEI